MPESIVRLAILVECERVPTQNVFSYNVHSGAVRQRPRILTVSRGRLKVEVRSILRSEFQERSESAQASSSVANRPAFHFDPSADTLPTTPEAQKQHRPYAALVRDGLQPHEPHQRSHG